MIADTTARELKDNSISLALMENKSLLDIFVIDPGAHSVRAGRAEDFPSEEGSPHIVLPSRVLEPGPNPEQPVVASRQVQLLRRV